MKRISGMLKLSHITVKSTILRQASADSAPPPTLGLLAMIPTTWPPSRASATMAERPNRGFISKIDPTSKITSRIFFML